MPHVPLQVPAAVSGPCRGEQRLPPRTGLGLRDPVHGQRNGLAGSRILVSDERPSGEGVDGAPAPGRRPPRGHATSCTKRACAVGFRRARLDCRWSATRSCGRMATTLPPPTLPTAAVDGRHIRTQTPNTRRIDGRAVVTRSGGTGAAAAARHRGDPALLPDQHHAGVLRRRDAVQSPRPRPVGAQLRLHRVLRRLGRPAPAGLHAEGQAVHRVRERRGDQQLPAARIQRCASTCSAASPRGAAEGGDGVLRRGNRAHLHRSRLRPDPAVGGAARAPRFQDRHHPARRRGGRAQRAQHPDVGELVGRARRADHRRRARHRRRAADALRRQRQDHVLPGECGGLGLATPTTSSASSRRS